MSDLESTINDAFEKRDTLSPADASGDVGQAVEAAIALIDSGKERVAEPIKQGEWKVNQWLKKAVLLSFPPSESHNNRS